MSAYAKQIDQVALRERRVPERTFPDEFSCTAWDDCNHDGICHDPKGCGAKGPNHDVFYALEGDA